MAQIITVICDRPGCGKQRGENNHWWTIEYNLNKKSMFIHPMMPVGWGDLGVPKDHILIHACGLECLGILESKIKEGANPLK